MFSLFLNNINADSRHYFETTTTFIIGLGRTQKHGTCSNVPYTGVSIKSLSTKIILLFFTIKEEMKFLIAQHCKPCLVFVQFFMLVF